jgi:hypothetical protein
MIQARHRIHTCFAPASHSIYTDWSDVKACSSPVPRLRPPTLYPGCLRLRYLLRPAFRLLCACFRPALPLLYTCCSSAFGPLYPCFTLALLLAHTRLNGPLYTSLRRQVFALCSITSVYACLTPVYKLNTCFPSVCRVLHLRLLPRGALWHGGRHDLIHLWPGLSLICNTFTPALHQRLHTRHSTPTSHLRRRGEQRRPVRLDAFFTPSTPSFHLLYTRLAEFRSARPAEA